MCFSRTIALQCRSYTLLLELEVNCPQHHSEKQVDGKRGKEPPKIEAERCAMAHSVCIVSFTFSPYTNQLAMRAM